MSPDSFSRFIFGKVRRVGFQNFYLASEQGVSLRLSNRGTYGDDRGAGWLIMTLMDSTGRVVARGGPGATTATP